MNKGQQLAKASEAYDVFKANTTLNKNKERFDYSCNKGLWGVSAADEETALREAFHYFIQYFQDGEYDDTATAKAKRFEPPANVRGDIARTYFYMVTKYKIRISKQQAQLMRAWHKLDPVDDWEREKNRRIEAIQGDRNRFIPQKTARKTTKNRAIYSCSTINSVKQPHIKTC